MVNYYFRVTAGLPHIVALALGLGGASLGYFFGRRFAPPAARAEADTRPGRGRERASGNVGENKDDDRERDDSDAEGDDHDSDLLSRIKAEPTEECKLVRS